MHTYSLHNRLWIFRWFKRFNMNLSTYVYGVFLISFGIRTLFCWWCFVLFSHLAKFFKTSFFLFLFPKFYMNMKLIYYCDKHGRIREQGRVPLPGKTDLDIVSAFWSALQLSASALIILPVITSKSLDTHETIIDVSIISLHMLRQGA